MGQALYRKYRPRSLKTVAGQEPITDTLSSALKQGRISHAYLFTGPRGVGKTSVARILAHEINGLPYDDDGAHIDIIEIDAASNRRIDEIRDLRDKIYVAPASAKYKVYIIDEVHMLTREAFNALLKTLEEPPEHAVFILATTDAHKLPDTIVSRTQRFTFKPVAADKMVAHLSEIAKNEKIKISAEALRLLAEHGEGSFRDSISLLDQLSAYGKPVDISEVYKLLGIPPAGAVSELLMSLDGGNASEVVSKLAGLLSMGFQPAAIARQLGDLLRAKLLGGSGPADERTFNLMSQFIKVPVSHDPERFLEIILLSAASTAGSPARAPEPARSKPEPKPDQPVPKESSDAAEPNLPSVDESIAENKGASSESGQPDKPAAGSAAFGESIWPDFLNALKKRNYSTLYAVVRMAKPAFPDENTLELAFAFPLHEKQVREAGNRKKLTDVMYELTGKDIGIKSVFDESSKPRPKPGSTVENDAGGEDLAGISNIFGSVELLEP